MTEKQVSRIMAGSDFEFLTVQIIMTDSEEISSLLKIRETDQLDGQLHTMGFRNA